ncbi:hypothetical protein GQR58_000216 [Nymphon striatum]|nr:hypothetical protein GQR58_000216 [Nymphon striatum]
MPRMAINLPLQLPLTKAKSRKRGRSISVHCARTKPTKSRGAGPFGLLNMVDERCGGMFDNIDDVISKEERAAFMAGYKAAAGFAIETLERRAAHYRKGTQSRHDGLTSLAQPQRKRRPALR